MSSTSSDQYGFDNLWECSCDVCNSAHINGTLNNNGFVNYWASSGTCCNHRRFTVWIIFNLLFVVLLIFFCMIYCKEKRDREKKFSDFTIRESARIRDDEYNNNSIFFIIF